ncbi:MAG TPA: peptidoglycan recognition family protein [Solirubrobacterales bacterium]|nr:peptidoglycan recognition family protein [Solirubrobacterales bacterium]
MRLALGALIAATAVGLLAPSPPPPPIKAWPIPYGAKRKHQMADYSARHYGERTWRLRRPRVIVEHMAQTGSVGAIYNTFAANVPDVELHELPGVCAHFAVSSRGRIFRLVNLRTRCRHTVGLNWTAIGIEHVGYGDGDVLGNRRALSASLRLTHWLRCRFGIRVRDVIGHAESLRSPYHRERVPSLRRQTHGDWRHASMQAYRKKLRQLGRCGDN